MFEAVVIGASAGGMRALTAVLSKLPASFALPIAVVQHLDDQSDGYLAEHLDRASAIAVKEAENRETLKAGTAYLAPAGYHLLIEPGRVFSLSIDDRVNFVRPAIDILFESAADVFAETLIGVVLTGANADGAKGLKQIKKRGGFAIVQNPKTAEAKCMPESALAAASVDFVLDLDDIAPRLVDLCNGRHQ